MNWTGGALQRSRGSNAKAATSRIQKQHFARARQRLLIGPQSPPSIDLSVFQNAKVEKRSDTDYRILPKTRRSGQKTAEKAGNMEPVVERSRKPRIREVNSMASGGQQLIQGQRKRQSSLGTHFPPPLLSKNCAKTDPIGSDGAEIQYSSPRSTLDKVQSGTSTPAQTPSWTTSSALKRKRMELLCCRDWVSLDHSKPVKVYFDSIEDKNLIGKRRRVESKESERRVASLRCKRLQTFYRSPSKHGVNIASSTQDVSIHIGSSVLDNVSPSHRIPDSTTSQNSGLSEEMLLDHTGSSVVSLDRGDPYRQCYHLQESSSRDSSSKLGRDAKAPTPSLRRDVRSSPHGLLENLYADDSCEHGQGKLIEPLRRVPGSIIKDDSEFQGLRLRFVSTPEAHPKPANVQSSTLQAQRANRVPLMHGALVPEVDTADAQGTTSNKVPPEFARDDITSLARQYQSVKAPSENDCEPSNCPTIEPIFTRAPHVLRQRTISPTLKNPTSEPENEETLWRQFVFGSQESTPGTSQETRIHKVESDPSSLLVQHTSSGSPRPRRSKQAALQANISTEALASSVTSATGQTDPRNPRSPSRTKTMSQSNFQSCASDELEHQFSVLQESQNIFQRESTVAFPPKSCLVGKHYKARHSTNQGSIVLPTSTGAATCASPFTVSSDKLGWSPNRIQQHLIFKKPKRYDGSQVKAIERTVLGSNRKSGDHHARREGFAKRLNIERDYEEDQIEDW